MAFPNHKSELVEIAERHVRAVDGPLLFALYFRDDEHPDSDSMLEVYSKYNNGRISSDGHLWVTEFKSIEGMPLINGENLRLTITNRTELIHALDEDWAEIRPIIEAIRANEYFVTYPSDQARVAASSGFLYRLKRKSKELSPA